MNKLTTLADKMKQDWDDRINLHHRFWMGDFVHSDEEMWASGKRDLGLILENLCNKNFSSWNVLEYGCGVGRILYSASDIFNTIIGTDVSDAAINKSKELLSKKSNISLTIANGQNLVDLQSNSLDLVYSFACLNHIPLDILPNILMEIHRVIKLNSYAVLQFYIGPNPKVVKEDTIVIRGYPEDSIKKSFEELGFHIENSQSLKVPFDAKDHERNLTPHLFTLKKIGQPSITLENLRMTLNPDGEIEADSEWKGSNYEYRLSATLLQEQAKRGDTEGAIETLNYALRKYKDPDPGSSELLHKLKKLL